MTEIVYLALGSNLGDRAHYLASARAAIAALPGTELLGESRIEETEPFGPPDQGRYLNQMLAIRTEFAPDELLRELQRIESENGRERGERWGSRTLDLDIVRFGDRRISTSTLTVPHPGLERRDFWQRQLAQIDTR